MPLPLAYAGLAAAAAAAGMTLKEYYDVMTSGHTNPGMLLNNEQMANQGNIANSIRDFESQVGDSVGNFFSGYKPLMPWNQDQNTAPITQQNIWGK